MWQISYPPGMVHVLVAIFGGFMPNSKNIGVCAASISILTKVAEITFLILSTIGWLRHACHHTHMALTSHEIYWLTMQYKM